MRRLIIGVALTAMLAVSQAAATAPPVLRSGDRIGATSQSSNAFLESAGDAGGLVLLLGFAVIIAAAINGNNIDSPSSP